MEPRKLLESWLRYQRHEFIRKLRDLSEDQLVAWSVPPVELFVLGLVRHVTQMEHVYLSWGLGWGSGIAVLGSASSDTLTRRRTAEMLGGWFPSPLRAAIEARAEAEQTTTSEIIREAIRRFLEVA